ncbi:MAG: chromate efflux transporter [Coleofasciculaceae cyanobacterium SM2_1_6]|nr:chromate efflux transporter [Coleofasciculaceae cyanobacterium SM2_1_6]
MEAEEIIAYKLLNPQEQRERLKELALVFLRLGTIAFGGPAAHIAMIDQEVVTNRCWMSRARLLDLLGITNLIPGPNSTELAIHVGYERAGWRGLLIAGSCFILPAMAIVWGLAMVYDRYQTLPQMGWLLYGIKPVILAIIIQALGNLGKKAAKDLPTILAGIMATIGYLAGINEILLLIILGLAVMVIKNLSTPKPATGLFLFPISSLLAQVGQAPVNSGLNPVGTVSWGTVFLAFLKIGFVLYGSGYVLLAFLQREFVERNQWLTSQQLLDAVAIGQITPGPVFTTATFIGYLLAGNAGAIAGTVGIFLPSFLLVLLVNPWVDKLRQSPWTSGLLDGINAASLGLMAGVLFTLAQAALVDWQTIVIAALSLIAVFRFSINSAWLVLAGGAIGLLLYLSS